MEIIPIDDRYSVGNLYVFDQQNEIVPYSPNDADIAKFQSFTYDKRSGNVHIFPNDALLSMCCSELIAAKRECLYNEIIKQEPSLICSSRGSGKASRYSGTHAESSTKMFQFIPLCKEGIHFDLTFVRFFRYENQVGCILNSLQLKIYRKSEPNSLKYYPSTGHDAGETDFSQKPVYYNFPVAFNESSSKTVDKLRHFISKTAPYYKE